MNAANLPGRFLPPLISDTCLGPLNTLIPCTFLTASILFLWLGADSSTSIHLVACFYGFAAAGIQSLYNAVIWGFVSPAPSASKVGSSATSTTGSEHDEGVPVGRSASSASTVAKHGGAHRRTNSTAFNKEIETQSKHDAEASTSSSQPQEPNYDEGLARLRLAMVFVVIGIACLTGAPIGGKILDQGTNAKGEVKWTGAQVFAGTSVAIGGCFLVAARYAKMEGWESGRV
ncbi:MAG: hypothetical protein Q9183_006107 [Haloplaca sp. 2 TL-2023]